MLNEKFFLLILKILYWLFHHQEDYLLKFLEKKSKFSKMKIKIFNNKKNIHQLIFEVVL